MKLLLYDNVPLQLKFDFPEHEVTTVRDIGWSGIQNSALMQLLVKEMFDVLITFDKNLQHQQNFQKYPVTVFVLSALKNTYPLIAPPIPFIKEYLEVENLHKGIVVIRL